MADLHRLIEEATPKDETEVYAFGFAYKIKPQHFKALQGTHWPPQTWHLAMAQLPLPIPDLSVHVCSNTQTENSLADHQLALGWTSLNAMIIVQENCTTLQFINCNMNTVATYFNFPPRH